MTKPGGQLGRERRVYETTTIDFVSDCSAEGNYEGLLLLPISLFKSIVVCFCTAERRICMRFGAGIDSDRDVFLSGAKVCSEDMVATVGIRL